MSARNDLDCLLEKGLISQELYDILAPIVGITGDLSFALSIATGSALAGSVLAGEPDSMVTITPIAAVAVLSPAMPADVTKVVVTPFGNDVIFTVVAASTPTTTFGHVMKKGFNYTFTPVEFDNAKFLAFDGSASASLTVTYYK